MVKAWDGLFVIRTKLHNLNTQADIALATTHNAVDEARDDVASTAEQLAELLAPADPLLLRSKEKKLALAKTSLTGVEALLADLHERLEFGSLPSNSPRLLYGRAKASTRPCWTR